LTLVTVLMAHSNKHSLSSSYLKAIGAAWLRYELGCPLVVFERGIWYWCSNPDIFAVRNSGNTIEVEVKCDYTDFKNNFEKNCIRHRKTHNHNHPTQFYFLVSDKILTRVLESGLLTDEGVLSVDGSINHLTNLLKVKVFRRAKSKKSSKLSPKNLVRLIQCQSNTLVALALSETLRRAQVHEVDCLLPWSTSVRDP
jgi:hypothetical protein